MRAGAVLRGGFIAAAGSVAGMDVFFPKSRKVRQPAFPLARAPTIGGRMRAFPSMRRLCREKKRTARLDKSGRAVL